MLDPIAALRDQGFLRPSEAVAAAGITRTILTKLVFDKLVRTRSVLGHNNWFVDQQSLVGYLEAHPEIPRGKPRRLSARFAILERDGFACRYCGRRPPQVVLQVDHVIPRSAGGDDTDENLITACEECNQGKAARVGVEAPIA
jgi:hypothetical protein